MSPEEQQVLTEIAKARRLHVFFRDADHTILHLTFWASILASCTAATLVAYGEAPKLLVALLAAVPALCITIESTFRFAERHMTRFRAVLDLDAVRRALEIEHGMTAAEASKRLCEIEEAVAKSSPLPNVASLSKKG